tara:strand:+ start:1242 stop:1841 length:600 start_codon:yes stop_codon:yes gene_type:complete
MKRFKISKSKLNPNFIGSWFIEPLSISDEIINYFELNISKQRKGSSGYQINTDIKDTTDISIEPKDLTLPGNEIFTDYFNLLFECHKDYMSQWPFLNSVNSLYEIGNFNIQKYNPGQHFKKIHTERGNLGTLHRVFAFMTYLNDVEEGGSTYFSHYDLEIIPKKGLTLIWPAEWTHAHRGNIIKKGTKYIITGWINFAK